MSAPVASGWSESPGWPRTHWKAPPCHGAPPKRPFAVALKISPARQPGGPKPMPRGVAVGRSVPHGELRLAAEYGFLAASPAPSTCGYRCAKVAHAVAACRERSPMIEKTTQSVANLGYHAHIYYDPRRTRAVAEQVCAEIGEKFRVEIDGFRDTPVGPHPIANVLVIFKPDQ